MWKNYYFEEIHAEIFRVKSDCNLLLDAKLSQQRQKELQLLKILYFLSGIKAARENAVIITTES